MKISAVIITFNEESKIPDAIRSVAWADEVLVVDSESTDHTTEIARDLGARVIVEKWRGFAAQKQYATDQASFDHIFSLDADERVSEKLKDEITKIRDSNIAADGYRIPRLSTYLGREIRHSGWYPDWQLRFFDRRKGRWKDVAIHESIEMEPEATTSKLTGDIVHFSIDSIKQHAEMINTRYAPLSAEAMFGGGTRTSPLRIAGFPVVTFLQTYFIKAGFLDGFAGLVISYFAAYNVFLKHMLLWERQNQSN
ncbi:MAG TPA: glycosyltransferase family 2 protein [Pyrinomonadaceae bacterium]|nr:glycosyltransferase family 2 protein [Pyrinomonadaceae bacterium]